MASPLLAAGKNEGVKQTLTGIADHICGVAATAAEEGKLLSVIIGIRCSYGNLETRKSVTVRAL